MTYHDPGLFGLFWLRATLVLLYVGVPVLLVGAVVWWAARRARFDALRVAALATRHARRYVPRWSVPVLLSAGVLAVAVPIVLTVLPTIRYGPWRPDVVYAPQITLPGGVLQWPAADCVPPAALAVLALAVGGIALRRVVLLPPVAVGQPGLDEGARRNSARAVIAAVLATELFVLAAQVILVSGGVETPDPVGGPYVISRILLWCGIGLAVAAVLLWCVLGRWKRLVAEPPAAAPAGPAAA